MNVKQFNARIMKKRKKYIPHWEPCKVMAGWQVRTCDLLSNIHRRNHSTKGAATTDCAYISP